jgi:RecJ-like exonuclease
MGESGTAKVCPYCEGKGYVSVIADLPSADDPREELSGTTWVRKPCPLCDGKGSISGDDTAPPKVPLNEHPFAK